jgi:hypothetical protein
MSDGPEEMDLARQIQNVYRALAEHGRAGMPIWITEMGWTSDIKKPEEVNAAATCLLQSYVIAAAEGVERLYWFNLQDWNEAGHLEGWGLVSPEGVVKRTLMQQYRFVRDQLVGAQYLGCRVFGDPAKSEECVAYVFEKNGSTLIAAWPRSSCAPGHGLIASLPAADLVTSPELLTSKARTLDVFQSANFYKYPAPPRHDKLMARTPEKASPLVNASFEKLDRDNDVRLHKPKPYGWQFGKFSGGHDRGKFEVTDGATTGSKAVALHQTTDSLWQSWPIPALPGESFRLTAKVRAENATGENSVQLNFYGNTGWGDRGGPQSATTTGTTEGWRTVEISGTAPANADVLRVNCVSMGNRGMVAFDDLVLTRTGTAARKF